MLIVDTALKKREAEGRPIRVGMIGAGFMGRGLANQIINSVPGVRLVAVSNRSLSNARRAYVEHGAAEPLVATRQGQLEDAIGGGKPVVTEDADLLVCAKDSEETVEACTYDGYRTMSRVRINSEVRFISIKTGEELWRTNLTGAAPRACEDREQFSERSMSGTIRGNSPDPSVAYNQFIAR